jgi:hypothetical protein
MTNDEQTEKDFLEELYRQTGGDTENQVSMYDIGNAIGHDKANSGALAEELMVRCLAELRTLAGGISITSEGLAELGITSPNQTGSDGSIRLTDEPVAGSDDINIINQICNEIKTDIASQKTIFTQLEEIVIDLKTIEVQLLSPRPKTAVIRELFRSILSQLETVNGATATQRLEKLLSP